MTSRSRPGASIPGDDMHDTAEELDALSATPTLRFAVESLGAQVTPAFDQADRKALSHQRWYRVLTLFATTFGTVSILLSIVGLAMPSWALDLLLPQAIVLGLTTVAVLLGLFAYRHENWLLERCRAEQLRALKFTRLLDETLWNGDEKDRLAWLERVRADVERLRALRYHDILSIAGTEEVPGLRATRALDPSAMTSLAAYYNRKRLGPQRDYFLQVSSSSQHIGARALPLFFFGAVFLEILQVVLSYISDAPGGAPMPSGAVWLAAAAVALPAIWAGIRTYQGAREDSRNSIRSKARHGAMTQLSERMLASRSNPVELLWTMRLTEFVLQVDQREWLRLLREAEWYG